MLEGGMQVDVDGLSTELQAGELISLSPLQHLMICHEIRGMGSSRFALLLFDDRFYCIFGNDHEVSCRGQLFNGSSYVPHIQLSPEDREQINYILGEMRSEFVQEDRYKEEALRSWLKLYIIRATRATVAQDMGQIEKEIELELVRAYINLIDEHYRTHKFVHQYAEMLHCTTKTLTRKVVLSGRGTPLSLIHDRIKSEAVRRLLYTDCSTKELAEYLGFDTPSKLSRFFTREMGMTMSAYRRQYKQKAARRS